MGESQSRYSIVERLAMKKLELLDSKGRIDEEIQNMKEELTSREKGIPIMKKISEENLAREVSRAEKLIAEVKARIAFKEKQKATQIKLIDNKIKEVDASLKAIQEISKTAPSPEEQK